jgi:hypothetical protein
MTSVLNVDTIADKAGTGPVGLTKQHAAKMWAFIGGDGTPSITGSFNVASLTDENTGVVRANFTNSMNDANFSNLGTPKEGSFIANLQELSSSNVRATSSMVLKSHSTSSTSDVDGRNYAVLGDLA